MVDQQRSLVNRLIQQEALAYQEIVNLYANRLLKLAFFIVKDHQLAEDVVQESFISLYKNIRNFKEESQLSTWLIRITINQAKKTIKPSWFKRVFLFQEVESQEISSTPEEFLTTKEDDEELRIALEALPLIYKEVLYLFYYEELTIKEMVEILDTGESTLKSRLKRGREKLKEAIEERRHSHETRG